MKVISSILPLDARRPLVATIGFFDGVHRGHHYLIRQVGQVARERGWSSAVVTFPKHPRQVMQADYAPRLLVSFDEKMQLLAQTGVEGCILLEFTPELARLTARQFMQMLAADYGVAVLVIGYDHRFGHNRSEGFDDYVRYGRELGIEVIQAHQLPPDESGMAVSSSRIRQLLLQGEVAEASRMLGYDYFLQGEVESGYQVGRTIGFPTANLLPNDPFKLIPADGVYAVRVKLLDDASPAGGQYVHPETTNNGMLCIGHRPTLQNGPARSIEVHLFDFQGDLYHRTLRVEFVQFTRCEQRFDSLEALRERISLDEQEIRRLLRG